MAYLTIRHTGILSLTVDKGRTGFQHLGISEGGPADNYSFTWANWLVGNEQDKTMIETVGAGLRFSVSGACVLAVTGAATRIMINNLSQRTWQSVNLNAGDVVTIEKTDNGLRSYIAINGGFMLDPVFSSCTTVMRDKLGGLYQDGEPLKETDKIEFQPNIKQNHFRKTPKEAIPNHLLDIPVRVVEGYQNEVFTQVQKTLFYHREYSVHVNSNRMALRLTGEPLNLDEQGLMSEGITKGAIQIPPDGLPIIMLCDRQTVGGYPKIGSVLSLDCDRLAQLCAGVSIKFVAITVHQAQNLLMLRHSKLAELFSTNEEQAANG